MFLFLPSSLHTYWRVTVTCRLLRFVDCVTSPARDHAPVERCWIQKQRATDWLPDWFNDVSYWPYYRCCHNTVRAVIGPPRAVHMMMYTISQHNVNTVSIFFPVMLQYQVLSQLLRENPLFTMYPRFILCIFLKCTVSEKNQWFLISVYRLEIHNDEISYIDGTYVYTAWHLFYCDSGRSVLTLYNFDIVKIDDQ